MSDTMLPFGSKQAWLAVRAGDVLGALGLRDLGTVKWRDGLDLAYLTDDRVAVTPPLNGWTLAVGRHLLINPPDVPGLSAALKTEVQFFSTHRVTESHKWMRAVDGLLIRSFGYVGQTGQVTSWFGEPSPDENLPETMDPADEDTTVLVGEQDVLRVAGAWSIDPTTLAGEAPGPLRMGAA
jgi:hypothetical protein